MNSISEEQKQRMKESRERAIILKSRRNANGNVRHANNSNNYLQPTKNSNNSLAQNNKDYIVPTNKNSLIQNNPNPLFKNKYCSSNNCNSALLKCQSIAVQRFLVIASYNAKLVTAFKSFSTRKYDPETKGWSFSLNQFQAVEEKLKSLGYKLPYPEDTIVVKNSEGGSSTIRINNDNCTKGSCFLLNGNRFEIDLPYNQHCINIFKTISSGSYNSFNRKWTFHLSDYNLLFVQLRKIQAVYVEPLSHAITTVFKDVISGKEIHDQMMEYDLSEVDEKIGSSLMPFQKQGVNFAISRHGKILLADDMGLGKTVQSICIAAYYRHHWPLLIVCPSSVRLMWKESLLLWLPTQIDEDEINVILKSKDTRSSCYSVTIISYDLLSKQLDKFVGRNYEFVILDESHFIKNFKTARFKAVTKVIKNSRHILLLSGTPALSRPVELFTQLSVLRSDLFPNFHAFGLRYCAAKQNNFGWDYSGSSNMEELRLILQKTVMLRRTKGEVLAQLPPKLRRTVTLDVGSMKCSVKQKKAMAKAKENIQKKGISGVEKHGILLQYFNETARLKLNAVRDYVLDLLEGGHRFLLFAHHKIMLDAIQQDLDKKNYIYIRIDGSTPSDRRQSEVLKFQENPHCKVALLSITAANMGITLNSASLVVFSELFWNPGILVQAEDRCYRIGQRDVVNIHYLIAKGTADDYIWQLVKEKLDVLSKAGLNETNFEDTEQHQGPCDKTQNKLDKYFMTKTEISKSNDDHKCDELQFSNEEFDTLEILEHIESQKNRQTFGKDMTSCSKDVTITICESKKRSKSPETKTHPQDQKRLKKWEPPFKST